MKNSLVHAFSSTAESYDQDRSRLIPDFECLYGWAVALIPEGADRILDLGAGTGILSAMMRQRFPSASLHLVDLSDAMLAQARQRFKDDGLVTFQTADYAVAPLGGPYHAVVSALSIHHLSDDGKRGVFQRCLDLLLPGGVFVNAEQVLGPTPKLERAYKQHWLRGIRELGATDQQIAESLFRQQQDRCATVEEQMRWMAEAGFEDVDCWFKSGRFATLAGTRPE